MDKTKGQIEAEITEAVIRFEKEYMGRGPEEAKTYIVDDMVLVRLKGVLSRAEHQLATTGEPPGEGNSSNRYGVNRWKEGVCFWKRSCAMLSVRVW